MGGTSTDVSLCPGHPLHTRDFSIAATPVAIPVVDIVEVGAGGGSIAWIDPDGGIHVGPQSAGADPGPACYGKGNPDPVVTDANLVLGRINPKRFLNGNMPLDVAAAERAIKEKIADPLRLSVRDAARGIIRIADAAMSLAVRATRRSWRLAAGGRCMRARSRERFSCRRSSSPSCREHSRRSVC